MKPSPDCPTLDEWRQFASASLAHETRLALDDHLEACSTCPETLATLDDATGPLAQALVGLAQGPAPSAAVPDDDLAYRELVERAKAIRSSSAGGTAGCSSPDGAGGLLP